MSSVFDEIRGVKRQKLASDMAKTFTATVLAASKHKGEYGSSLKLELQTEDGVTFSTTYRIPKALTGKGQLDLLLLNLQDMKVPLEEITGKTFMWQLIELPGSVKGNPRHYPVKLVKAK